MRKFSADSAYILLKVGKDFLEAAKLVRKHGSKEPFWPVYSLGCQALELYLKAFLRAEGMSLKDLKRIGHDLQRALREANETGFGKIVNFTKEDEQTIGILAPIYRNREFQYKGTGKWTLCSIENLLSSMDRNYSALLARVVR